MLRQLTRPRAHCPHTIECTVLPGSSHSISFPCGACLWYFQHFIIRRALSWFCPTISEDKCSEYIQARLISVVGHECTFSLGYFQFVARLWTDPIVSRASEFPSCWPSWFAFFLFGFLKGICEHLSQIYHFAVEKVGLSQGTEVRHLAKPQITWSSNFTLKKKKEKSTGLW